MKYVERERPRPPVSNQWVHLSSHNLHLPLSPGYPMTKVEWGGSYWASFAISLVYLIILIIFMIERGKTGRSTKQQSSLIWFKEVNRFVYVCSQATRLKVAQAWNRVEDVTHLCTSRESSCLSWDKHQKRVERLCAQLENKRRKCIHFSLEL